MKTTVTTTIETMTMLELSKLVSIDIHVVRFTYGRTEYLLKGTYQDSSSILVIGRKEKSYKVFDALKNANKMVKVTIKTIETDEQTGVDEIELVSPNEDHYTIKDTIMKGKELQVGGLYADIFYNNACVMELVSKTETELEFRNIYGDHYGPEMIISVDSGDWYPVNQSTEQPDVYVGAHDNKAYYATPEPATLDTMQVSGLYATPANSIGEQNIYELLEITKEGYLVMQIQAGPVLSDTKNSGITTFINPENKWYKAYYTQGYETKVGDYIVTPERVEQNAETLVFGGLYADVNGKEATIFQYKGISEYGYVKMRILHNASDYCAEVGEIVEFPKNEGTFNVVRYIK